MNELERGFIRQSTEDLQLIFNRLNQHQNVNPPANFLNELFRTLHTIKGTAQTFGFSGAGNLAHSLENLIAAAKKDVNLFDQYKAVLNEGIILLIDSFERKTFEIPIDFAEKFKSFRAESEPRDFAENRLDEIPETVVEQLSVQEKSNLHAALENGKNLFILEIGFELASFAADFKNFRERLNEKGEIIAALPCSRFSAEKRIGFQIVTASDEDIKSFAEKHAAKIIFENNRKFSESLQGVFAKVVGHGKNAAKMFNKNIEFVVLADDFEPQTKMLKLIFDVLLHLVRNAVSHAIAEKGRIEIDFRLTENGVVLSVADDGKGLDTEKIKAKAIEKNLKINFADASEQEIADLIFLPEFSTAATLNEISGRGIGLDAVKSLITNAKGKISVKTGKDKGTIFEMFLPKTF